MLETAAKDLLLLTKRELLNRRSVQPSGKPVR